jgi:hypothetical protein
MATKKTKRKNPKRKAAAKRKNPTKRRSAARRKNPSKRRTAARRKNPTKRRSAARRKNPSKRRAAPRRTNARKAPRRRNAKRRTRRKNPGWGNLETGLMGLAAGTAAALVSSWINDSPLGNRGPTAQNASLLVEGAAAVYFIESPAILSGVLVGLFLVPIAKFVYNAAPFLANPRPMGPPMLPAGTTVVVGPSADAAPPAVVVNPDGSTSPVAAATMSALHRANIRYLGAMDRRYGGIGALHRPNMGALHRPNVGSLHRPAIGALHEGGMGNATISRSSHRAAGRTART